MFDIEIFKVQSQNNNELIDIMLPKLIKELTNDKNTMFRFTEFFKLACLYGNLELVQKIYDLSNLSEDLSFIFLINTCSKLKNNYTLKSNKYTEFLFNNNIENKLKILDWLYDLLKDEISNSILEQCIIQAINDNLLEVVKWLYNKNNKLLNNKNYLIMAGNMGLLDMCKLLLTYDDSLLKSNDDLKIIFNSACYKNDIDMVKWLYENNNSLLDDNIDILFKDLCKLGNKEIILWLYENKTDIKIMDECFTECNIYNDENQNKKIEIMNWYLNINKNTDIILFNKAFNNNSMNNNLLVCEWLLDTIKNKFIDLELNENNYNIVYELNNLIA